MHITDEDQRVVAMQNDLELLVRSSSRDQVA